jgi:CRP/FNR family transcriptional regulator, cyclic AMP receptor protein
MESERLDLRTVPVWERPAKVFDVFDALPPGGSVTLVTDNEPRGLATRIEQGRRHQVILDPRRVGTSEWVIHITRSTHEPDGVSVLSAIKRVPAFANVRPDTFEVLAREATVHTVRRGQVIIPEGTDWPNVGIVSEGVLAVGSGSTHSRPRIFFEVFPYEMFGEVEFFDEAPANARVSALSKLARYIRIPRPVLMSAAKADCAVGMALGRVCAQRSRDLMQSLATQGTMPIIARIAQALAPFAVPEQGLAPALAPLPNMTQAQIAAAAGTVKEVAARAIAELEQRGLLKRERGHIRFLDREKLVALIKEGE